MPCAGAVTNGKPAYIISNRKVNHHGANIVTQANESSLLFCPFTTPDSWNEIKRDWWGVRGQGSGLRRTRWNTAALESPFQMLISRRWYHTCLRAVCNQAPTSLHLSDCFRGAWVLQCPIHKRAEPSRQPTQMLHTLTWGHPPTLCCVNDSLPHITVKTASRLRPCDEWRLWSVEKKSPFKTFHQRSADRPNNTQRVRGGGLIDSN